MITCSVCASSIESPEGETVLALCQPCGSLVGIPDVSKFRRINGDAFLFASGHTISGQALRLGDLTQVRFWPK